MPRICKNSDLFRLYYEMMNLKQYVNEILNIHRDERVFDFEFDGQKFAQNTLKKPLKLAF